MLAGQKNKTESLERKCARRKEIIALCGILNSSSEPCVELQIPRASSICPAIRTKRMWKVLAKLKGLPYCVAVPRRLPLLMGSTKIKCSLCFVVLFLTGTDVFVRTYLVSVTYHQFEMEERSRLKITIQSHH